MAQQTPLGKSRSANMDRLSGDSPDSGTGGPGRAAEALQHPLTLACLFLSGAGLIHLLGLSPFPVGRAWGAALLPAAVAAAGSFYWAYYWRHRGPSAGNTGVPGLPGAGEPAAEDLDQLRDSLEEEFAALNSRAGLKSLADLEHEYRQVRDMLDSREGAGSLSTGYIARLVEETYRQGLRVLGHAQELTRTVRAANRGKLEQEQAALESEIARLRGQQAPPQHLQYREETINSHRQRLSLLDQQELRIDQLLYQVELCEASLARAHLELAALHADAAESSVGDVTQALESTIDRARAVQEELRQSGL